MPTIDTALPGSPCWIELMSVDQAASADFYAALFGWTSTEPNPEMGGYANFFLDGQIVAGLTLNRSEGAVADRWNTYLKAADALAVVEATPTHGGQVHFGPHQVTDLGSMSMIDDPGGATVGIWQPGTLTGYAAFGVPGAPVWHELMTRDYDKTLEFYRDVFGWTTEVMSDTPEFRYTNLGAGDNVQAGVMDATGFLPEGTPGSWSVYFQVTDADATAARALELGGRVENPPHDTPFGRLTVIADATGASFNVMQPN
jgi:predicted enzyme related to lactoylglutathione lyase